MCFYYDDYASVYHEQVRTARKPHKCDHCRREIAKGQRYVYGSGVFDGSGFSLKACGACELDRYRIHIIELGEGCSPHDSWADMSSDDVIEWMHYHDFDRSTPDEGQRFLAMKAAKATSGHAV
jgi:hypothetical protein